MTCLKVIPQKLLLENVTLKILNVILLNIVYVTFICFSASISYSADYWAREFMGAQVMIVPTRSNTRFLRARFHTGVSLDEIPPLRMSLSI